MNERTAADAMESLAAPVSAATNPSSLHTISVVVPVKDEEASLPILVGRIVEVAAESRLELAEIILVDDGSADGTWSAMEDLAARHRTWR